MSVTFYTSPHFLGDTICVTFYTGPLLLCMQAWFLQHWLSWPKAQSLLYQGLVKRFKSHESLLGHLAKKMNSWSAINDWWQITPNDLCNQKREIDSPESIIFFKLNTWNIGVGPPTFRFHCISWRKIQFSSFSFE